MADDALELIRLRNNFYRDNYRRVVGALLLMIFVNIVLVFAVFYEIYNPTPPTYFATSTDGRITTLYPLSDPMMSKPELLQWAERAAVAVNNYNFVNYKEALQNAQNNFTPDGWKYYMDALKSSGQLDGVIAKKLVANAVPTGAPVILEEGVISGRYAWKVQMPLLVTFQSASEQTQLPEVVTITISRVPTVDMPRGVAIVSYISSTSKVST